MTIRIVTDSACDLPEEMAKQLGIKVVPLFINVGNISYQDGIDITRKEFYEKLSSYESFPKTAAPGPDQFKHVYDQLAEEGATEVISIHISESLSNTVVAARQGAEKTDSVPVKVIDSQQLSLGAGLLVMSAAKEALEGKTVKEIIESILELTKRTYTIAVLETLEYLKRGGRMSVAVASIGTLLKIKPILKMNKGHPTVERVRTTRRAMERMVEFIQNLEPLQELHFVHTDFSQKISDLKASVARYIPLNSKPMTVSVTPVLGAHLGPSTVGFSFITCEGVELPCTSYVDELLRITKNIRG